ncbi:MAG: hypothetical protein LBG20_00370 [Holosporaceae bacterium]|jgi:hypothetical protein|nr:hypothetical protein [Holosporaceae bacterium]
MIYKNIDKILKNIHRKIAQILTKIQRGPTHSERRCKHEDCQNNDNNLGENQTNLPNIQQNSSTHSRKSISKFLSSKGAILIEFAVSIPVLLALLYYMHDLPKLARIKERMEFCAYCAVNMIQNVSHGAEITSRNIAHIWGAAFLPFFGGGVLQYQSETSSYVYPLGLVCDCCLIYLKGRGNGKVTVLWSLWNYWFQVPNLMSINSGIVRGPFPAVGSTVDATVVDKNLSIREGEYRAIVFLSITNSSSVLLPNGTRATNIPSRQLFGFWIYNPTYKYSNAYFYAYVIFTPKPGLFSETPPQ